MKGIERERVGKLPVWGWALTTALAVWGLYVLTLGPTTAFWDTSEYIATAHILGMPHPPGNPLFVLLGRVWIVMLEWTGLDVATRVNLLSATMSAAASGLWFLAVVRIWSHFAESRWISVTAGLVSVLVGATAFTVWSQSTVNEKVYTVSLLFVALITYVAMLWEDYSESWRGDRLVVLGAFLLGLGATNHQMSLLPVGALLVFVAWHSWRTLLRWRLLGAAAVAAAVGFSVQLLFVPIRSAQNPVIDEADSECPSLIEAVTPALYETVDGSKKLAVKCEALAASLVREQYAKPPLSDRQAPIPAQVANYLQYFDWQWARTLLPAPRAVVTGLFVLLGLVGVWRHARGDPDSFVYFIVLLATVTGGLVFYLNFKYGYSLYPEIPVDLHEVRERDYFYVVSFNLWGLYAGMGAVTTWMWLARSIERATRRPSWSGGNVAIGASRASLALATPVLIPALIPLVLNFDLADRRGDYSARDWAYNLLESVEPYAILFTNGDNDTFPLWYLQEVEGIRRDVTVIVHSYLGTKWYPKQLRDLTRPCPEGVDPLETPSVIVCQRPFDAEAAVGPYRGMRVMPPTRSILAMTDEEIDALQAFAVVPPDFPGASFSPSLTVSLPENRILTHPDLLVFQITRRSLGDRPVYFASTAPPVYQVWNLEPHLLRQGLAHKLVDGLLESTADTVQLGAQFNVRWIDRTRTETLLWDVFQLDYLLDWEIWPEPSTRASIPAQYYLAHIALGEAHSLRERPSAAEENYERGTRLLELSNRDVP
ncbi:MAG: DUF2723 domain-containing protein [Gemmatimonadota bacterium]